MVKSRRRGLRSLLIILRLMFVPTSITPRLGNQINSAPKRDTYSVRNPTHLSVSRTMFIHPFRLGSFGSVFVASFTLQTYIVLVPLHTSKWRRVRLTATAENTERKMLLPRCSSFPFNGIWAGFSGRASVVEEALKMRVGWSESGLGCSFMLIRCLPRIAHSKG